MTRRTFLSAVAAMASQLLLPHPMKASANVVQSGGAKFRTAPDGVSQLTCVEVGCAEFEALIGCHHWAIHLRSDGDKYQWSMRDMDVVGAPWRKATFKHTPETRSEVRDLFDQANRWKQFIART